MSEQHEQLQHNALRGSTNGHDLNEPAPAAPVAAIGHDSASSYAMAGYDLSRTQGNAQAVDNMAGVVAKPSLCRMVIYRGKRGLHAPRAAVVIGTQDSIMQEGIDAGQVSALSSDRHVHLHVFTPGDLGYFTEYDVPPGDGPGEWSWPPRSA